MYSFSRYEETVKFWKNHKLCSIIKIDKCVKEILLINNYNNLCINDDNYNFFIYDKQHVLLYSFKHYYCSLFEINISNYLILTYHDYNTVGKNIIMYDLSTKQYDIIYFPDIINKNIFNVDNVFYIIDYTSKFFIKRKLKITLF